MQSFREKDEQYPTTARLLKLLESSPNQFRDAQLSASHENIYFHEYLYALMEKKNVQTIDLIAGACISKTYTYQFVNGERIPGRDIVLRMGFFLKLKVSEVQRLLTLAGKGVLYPKIRRDAAVLFCLQKKMTLDEVNSFLDDLGEDMIL